MFNLKRCAAVACVSAALSGGLAACGSSPSAVEVDPAQESPRNGVFIGSGHFTESDTTRVTSVTSATSDSDVESDSTDTSYRGPVYIGSGH